MDGAYTKLLRVVKNVTWQQCITNEVFYAGLPRILTTIRERHLRFSGHCWELKHGNSWELKHGNRSVGLQAHIFVDLLEVDTGVPRDCLLAAMDDRVGWIKTAMGGRLRLT